jgi:surfactin synthase thioesterase subunit
MVFRGTRDIHTSADDCPRWVELTSGSFTLHMIAGDHFFPFTQRAQFLTALADELSKVSLPVE